MSGDMRAYFGRIGASRPGSGAAALAAVQRRQILSIPFEGIDPFLGRMPDLGRHALFGKIVSGGRGGYCFELNLLFGAALETLELPVRRVLGRVRLNRPRPGPRGHLAWIASVEGQRSLADAGFGGVCPLAPVPLAEGEWLIGGETFGLRRDTATDEWVLSHRGPRGWSDLYGFDEAHVTDADIEAANRLCATWDQMPFSAHLLVNGYDGACRLGLYDLQLVEQENTNRRRRQIADAGDLRHVLVNRLRLNLDADLIAALWLRLAGSDSAPPRSDNMPVRGSARKQEDAGHDRS